MFTVQSLTHSDLSNGLIKMSYVHMVIVNKNLEAFTSSINSSV